MDLRKLLALLTAGIALQSLQAASQEASVSTSGQFVIYGPNAAVRGEASQLAERTKANLLAIFRRPDTWQTPIIINLQSPEIGELLSPTALRFSQIGSGLKLQLDLIITRGMEFRLVAREILRALLLEMSYRREADIAPGNAYVEPPDWLLDGLIALAPGQDAEQLHDALSIPTETESLNEFLCQRPALFDSAGQLLYRAHALALVQMLLSMPDGPSRLGRYVDNLANSWGDSLNDLQQFFPELRADSDKVWKSAVARLVSTERYQVLTFAETEERLDELLCRELPPDTGAELDGLLKRRITPTDRTALNRLNQELFLLAACANPMMRPIVNDYREIVALLAVDKRRRLNQRIADATTRRARVAARMSDIEDYLNWFEATQSTTKSELFAGYFKAAAEHESPARRHDALSVYLDRSEAKPW